MDLMGNVIESVPTETSTNNLFVILATRKCNKDVFPERKSTSFDGPVIRDKYDSCDVMDTKRESISSQRELEEKDVHTQSMPPLSVDNFHELVISMFLLSIKR